MNGYELRRHLADAHNLHFTGLAYARMDDIHRGEHWPDPSHPTPDHDHDEGDARGSSMAHPGRRPDEATE